MHIVKEFPYLSIYWDEECHSLVIQWRGGFKDRNLKEGLLAALEEFKKRRPKAQWIGDTTDIGVIGLEDQTWVTQEWQPKLLETGLKYMAVIHPKSVIADMAATRIISKIPSTNVTIYNCASLQEARKWMKQQISGSPSGLRGAVAEGMAENTAKLTILDNAHVTLWYYPDKKIVHHQFHKFLYGDAFRDALNAGTETMKKYGAHKWLSDDRKNSALRQADLEWAHTDWFDRTRAAGWKSWAVVIPENVLGQLNMKREIRVHAARGLMTQMFSAPEDALKWLECQ